MIIRKNITAELFHKLEASDMLVVKKDLSLTPEIMALSDKEWILVNKSLTKDDPNRVTIFK